MSDPTLIVQLSDLHMRSSEDGEGAADRLRRAVDLVKALHPRPLALLVSGDIADAPDPAAYELAHQLLSATGLTLHAIPGNHDDRAMLQARFGGQRRADGTLPFVATHGELRLIGLDSTIPGAIGGALGTEQLGWLERTLAEEPGRPTLLALHHPPLATGIAAMDSIALDALDAARLEQLLAAHPEVLTVACGHVHTTMLSSFAARPLLVCPAISSTVRLDLRSDQSIPFATTPAPVGFAVHALIGGRLVSHVQALEQTAP